MTHYDLGGRSSSPSPRPQNVAFVTETQSVRAVVPSIPLRSLEDTTGCWEVFTKSRSGNNGRSLSLRQRQRVHSRSPCSVESIEAPANEPLSRADVVPSQVNKSEDDPVFQIIWRVDAPHLANESPQNPMKLTTENAKKVIAAVRKRPQTPRRPDQRRDRHAESLFMSQGTICMIEIYRFAELRKRRGLGEYRLRDAPTPQYSSEGANFCQRFFPKFSHFAF